MQKFLKFPKLIMIGLLCDRDRTNQYMVLYIAIAAKKKKKKKEKWAVSVKKTSATVAKTTLDTMNERSPEQRATNTGILVGGEGRCKGE